MKRRTITARSDTRLIENTLSDGSNTYDVEITQDRTGDTYFFVLDDCLSAAKLYSLFCNNVVDISIKRRA